MKFNYVDVEHWDRKPYFEHFMDNVRCTYSMTANIDITQLLEEVKGKQLKLYPTIIYMITTIVNHNNEFRTCYDSEGRLGVWDEMSPCYTVFHKDSKTFSNIWTSYNENFTCFYDYYLNDMKTYGDIQKISAKENEPPNTFPISSIPWVSFTGFNLNIFTEGTYLLPIFTVGKYFEQNEKALLPISVQVHHAVCDGYHVSKFINELQEMSLNFNNWIE